MGSQQDLTQILCQDNCRVKFEDHELEKFSNNWESKMAQWNEKQRVLKLHIIICILLIVNLKYIARVC